MKTCSLFVSYRFVLTKVNDLCRFNVTRRAQMLRNATGAITMA